jgi:Rieske 2Fe-2S family protein
MTAFVKTAETYQHGAHTLPRHYFTSPEVFALERESIFVRHWLCVGHQNQLGNPGDFFLQDVLGESLIILRDHTGALRGFYNLCRHRGTRLCENSTGRFSQTLQCPYHAWTYGLDGRLLGAPHMERITGFDRAEHSLHAVHLALWEGFIFANLAAQPRPFASVFASVLDKFKHWNIPSLRAAKRIEYQVSANWKLIFQNYSECYHCPPVHPGLAKLTPYDQGENDLVEGPFLGGFMPIPKASSITMSGKTCGLPVGVIPPEDLHRVYYYSIFPNMLLSLHPDYVMYHTIWPLGPERVLIHCDWLFHPDSFASTDFNPNDAIDFWDMTNRQDWHVCELSQAGISSYRYSPGFYSPRESIPAAFDREYLKTLGA